MRMIRNFPRLARSLTIRPKWWPRRHFETRGHTPELHKGLHKLINSRDSLIWLFFPKLPPCWESRAFEIDPWNIHSIFSIWLVISYFPCCPSCSFQNKGRVFKDSFVIIKIQRHIFSLMITKLIELIKVAMITEIVEGMANGTWLNND